MLEPQETIQQRMQKTQQKIARAKKRHKCTLGNGAGYCDGTKRGSAMRCPFLIRTGQGRNGCELAL